ncbi:hypothetical protein GDO81_019774 [Engystomops pustulosus]|uniref:Fibronectin type-III domain-containing protein n=1 Tax=Engystomops pustulosus TaxID=76066 RepID=A0AAV6Z1C6_ENGPU|nr:hypothetical protein GDO81_019774 [Engystomops pustulosus]
MQPRKGSARGPETSITAKTKIETPRGFRVTDVTYSSLLLRWERPQSLPDRYIVTLIHPNGKERKLRVPGKGDRIKVTGLDEDTEYRVLIRAEKGPDLSQDAETIGTTAGEERGRLTVEEKHVQHKPTKITHTFDPSVNLEPSKQGNQDDPRKELPHTRQEETMTDGQKNISVFHTRKNVKTIITTIYETHRSHGRPIDADHDHEDSEYPSKMPTDRHDEEVITSSRGGEDVEQAKLVDTKGNLPGTKVERWIITRNITHFAPSKTEIPIHLYEGESEVSEEITGLITGSGRLSDKSNVAKKLLEFESSRTKLTDKPTSLPYSGHDLDMSKSVTPETSTENQGDPAEIGLNGDEDEDDPTDPRKSRKHVTTLVRVNKIVNVSRKKITGREENNEMYNETIRVEGAAREQPPPSKPKNKTRILGPQIKAVIENLPEKLSLYNGTFIQRLESYLRATSYPLRGNQTVESVAKAIFLYLVKWKPHSFTDMVYDRLPQKTPGATGNSEPLGSSQLQGTRIDNRIQYRGKASDDLQEEDDSAGTASILSSSETLGRVEAAGEINVPVILTVDKYMTPSKERDENPNVISGDPASTDNSQRVDEVDLPKTSKPTASQKKVSPSKKGNAPKHETEDDIGRQTITETSHMEVGKDLEYDMSQKTILESTKKEPKEKPRADSRSGRGGMNGEDDIRRDNKQEHKATDKPPVLHKIHQVEKEAQVDEIIPNSQIPPRETTHDTDGTSGDKTSATKQTLEFGEDRDRTGPGQSPIVLKVPSPGAQGGPVIKQSSPTSIVVSLDGLGFIWDKALIIYSPWPPTADTTPQKMVADKGDSEVEIKDLVPGTSYRVDLHGMLRGRSSKSYSLVTQTGTGQASL